MDYHNNSSKTTKHTILVVDDTHANLELMIKILSAQYNVRAAPDGARALLSVQNTLPDLILLDVVMPDLDGFEVCRRLKADPKTQAIPIIFISALDETLDIVKAFSMGGADYVTKPFQAEELLARVATHMSLCTEINERKKVILTLSKEVAERRAAQKEAEIAKTDLIKQIEEAAKSDKANEAKSQFLANMSHEIRTPMNAIIGLMHLTLKTNLSTQQRDYLTKVQYSSDHLLGIINDILDFSKIEAGKLDMNIISFDLKGVFDKLEAILTNEMANKGLTVIFSPVHQLPFLVGDPFRLGQILINLVKNAIKFTEKGEIKVSTTIVDQTQQHITLHFSVKDTGIGLSQDHMAQLFQPFSQGDLSTTRQYGGTGLGLAICKQLVDIMEGQIGVESTLGVGSTFFFTISFPVALRDEGLRTSERHFQGCKVLVVEDNLINQQISRELLEGEQLQVVIADNGEQAVQKVKSEHFDLVFMDLQMPVMDGYLATREIRKILDADVLPIVAVTANTMKGDKEKCLSIGMNGYITKPISVVEMHAALCQWIKPTSRTEPVVDKIEKKILVVDNDRKNMKALIRLLENDHDVLIARSGQEALALATKNDRPDLILLDVVMPETNGYEVCRQLKVNEKSQLIPVVFMSEQVTEEDTRIAQELGVIGIIRKPFDSAVKLDIRQYLDRG